MARRTDLSTGLNKAQARKRAAVILTHDERTLAMQKSEHNAHMRALAAKKERSKGARLAIMPPEKLAEVERRQNLKVALGSDRGHRKPAPITLAPLKFLEKPEID